LELTLNGEGGGEGVGGGGEGGAELVAHRLEDVAAVSLDGSAEEGVMAGKGSAHRLRMLLPKAGAAFDVREQERDGSRGWWHDLLHPDGSR
jgi:hypothetical protein